MRHVTENTEEDVKLILDLAWKALEISTNEFEQRVTEAVTSVIADIGLKAASESGYFSRTFVTKNLDELAFDRARKQKTHAGLGKRGREPRHKLSDEDRRKFAALTDEIYPFFKAGRSGKELSSARGKRAVSQARLKAAFSDYNSGVSPGTEPKEKALIFAANELGIRLSVRELKRIYSSARVPQPSLPRRR